LLKIISISPWTRATVAPIVNRLTAGLRFLLASVVTFRFYVTEPTCCRGNAHSLCNRKSSRHSCRLYGVYPRIGWAITLPVSLLRSRRSLHGVRTVWRVYARDFTVLDLTLSASMPSCLKVVCPSVFRSSVCNFGVSQP